MGTKWFRLRVNYHDTQKDDLIVEAIEPLCRQAVSFSAPTLWLDRDWRGGPHISLCAGPLDSHSCAALTAAANRLLSTFIESKPSTRLVDASEQEAIHARLSRIEASIHGFEPWQADNTWSVDSEPPSLTNYPGARSRDLALCCATRWLMPTLETISRTRNDPGARSHVAVAMLLSYARALGPIDYGYYFMRAYVEKVVALAPDPDAAKAKLLIAYRRNQPATARLVDALLSEDSQAANGLYQHWSEATAWLLDQARCAAADGAQLVHSNETAADIYAQAGWDRTNDELTRTSFMRALASANHLWKKIDTGTFYQAHIFAVNQLYRHLRLIGINAREKLLLFDLLARFIEDRYGVDPLARLMAE